MAHAVVLGTRPEIIKLSPLIREFENRGEAYFILHTGQHYSYNMDRVFFEQLELPGARYHLDVGSGSHGEQTGKMLEGIEEVFGRERVETAIVQGDTNTVLAGALAAAKMHIPVAHVEAGLRSYDRRMPEEINRVVADHLSDYLFAPTEVSRGNLLKEGVEGGKIHVVGNTIVDALMQNLELARRRVNPEDVGVTEGGYILMTAHRAENVDDRERFLGIIEGVNGLAEETGLEVLYPIHPRSRKMMELFGLSPGRIRLTEPLDYLTFLLLESSAALVVTDSGGVQEEACILKVPCITVRDNTERPETVEVGANVLVGTDPKRIVEMGLLMLDRRGVWENPFGDGRSGKRIADILEGVGM